MKDEFAMSQHQKYDEFNTKNSLRDSLRCIKVEGKVDNREIFAKCLREYGPKYKIIQWDDSEAQLTLEIIDRM